MPKNIKIGRCDGIENRVGEKISLQMDNACPMLSDLKNTHAIMVIKKVNPICNNSLTVGKAVFSATIDKLFLLLLVSSKGRK